MKHNDTPGIPSIDLNRIVTLTDEATETLNDQYNYHPWTPEQTASGQKIRAALVLAAAAIINEAPPGPDRAVALRKLREARMDANSAITHGGKY